MTQTHDTLPASAPDETVRCYTCEQAGLNTAAVTLARGPVRVPLCGSCRAGLRADVDQALQEGTCATCGAVGVTMSGMCAAHEPAEAAMERISGAAQDVCDTLMDWPLFHSEEVSLLLARACEVGLHGKESLDTLIEALRLCYDAALAASEEKAAWCKGWQSWCADQPAPTGDQAEPVQKAMSQGWKAAAARVSPTQRAQASARAEQAYDTLRQQGLL